MRTEKSRLRRSLMSLQEKMRQMRHLTIGQQVDELNDALRGHYGYYGIAGNFRALQKVYRHVERYWCGRLRSRSWAARRLTWTDFNQLKEKIPLLRPKLRLPLQGAAGSRNAVNQRPKSVVQQICTLRSVGVGVGDHPGLFNAQYMTRIARIGTGCRRRRCDGVRLLCERH